MKNRLKVLAICGLLIAPSAKLFCMEQEEVYVEPAGSGHFAEKQSVQELLMVIGKSRAAVRAWKEALLESEAASEAAQLVAKVKKALKNNSQNLIMVDHFAAMIAQLNVQLEEFEKRVDEAEMKAERLSEEAKKFATAASEDIKAVCKYNAGSIPHTIIMSAVSKIDAAEKRFVQSVGDSESFN